MDQTKELYPSAFNTPLDPVQISDWAFHEHTKKAVDNRGIENYRTAGPFLRRTPGLRSLSTLELFLILMSSI